MSRTQTNETEPSNFASALNSTIENLENTVDTLLATLENIRKSEFLEKPSRSKTGPSEKGHNTEETRQLKDDATNLVEKSHQKTSETNSETETTANTDTDVQQSELNETEEPAPAKARESGTSERSAFQGFFNKTVEKASSKSSYYMLAIALIVFCVIIFKLCLMLFS